MEVDTPDEEEKVSHHPASSQSSSLSSCSSTSSSSSSVSPLRPNTRRSSSNQRQNRDQNQAQGRATRSSQNPDFAAKHRKFLNRVHDAISKSDDPDESSSGNGSPAASCDKGNLSDDGGKVSTRLGRSMTEKRRRESVSSAKLLNDTDNEDQSVESDSGVVDSPKKRRLSSKSEGSSTLKSVRGFEFFLFVNYN